MNRSSKHNILEKMRISRKKAYVYDWKQKPIYYEERLLDFILLK